MNRDHGISPDLRAVAQTALSAVPPVAQPAGVTLTATGPPGRAARDTAGWATCATTSSRLHEPHRFMARTPSEFRTSDLSMNCSQVIATGLPGAPQPNPLPKGEGTGVWPFLAGCRQVGRHETAQGDALIVLHNVLGGHSPIPKGLRPKAQGCEERATLGGIAESPTTPTGLRRGGTTPLGLMHCSSLTQGRPASRSNPGLRYGIPLGFQTRKMANLQNPLPKGEGMACGATEMLASPHASHANPCPENLLPNPPKHAEPFPLFPLAEDSPGAGRGTPSHSSRLRAFARIPMIP